MDAADYQTFLEFFREALDGAAACTTETPQKLVMRAALIAEAAIEELKKRAPAP